MSKQAKAHRFPGQHKHEEVLLVFRKHALILRKQLILGMLAIVLGLLPAAFIASRITTMLAVGVAVITTAYWFWAWVGWYYSVYIATNERIIEVRQRGFFDRRVTEFGLDKVQNINYHIKGLQAVLFRYGDIAVRTYVGELVMSNIHKPVVIQEQLVAIVREYGAGGDSTEQGA